MSRDDEEQDEVRPVPHREDKTADCPTCTEVNAPVDKRALVLRYRCFNCGESYTSPGAAGKGEIQW